MTVFDRLEAQLLDAYPHRARRALPRPAPRHVLAFAAAAVAVAVVLIAGLSGGSTTSSRQPAANTPAVVPAETTVAVLNSSRTRGAARAVATALQRDGWEISTVTNGPDQNLDSSYVDFTPGHSEAAGLIAKRLGIGNVLPVTEELRAVAGRSADVVVVVGREQIPGAALTLPDGPEHH
jgi:hypothetical protein